MGVFNNPVPGQGDFDFYRLLTTFTNNAAGVYETVKGWSALDYSGNFAIDAATGRIICLKEGRYAIRFRANTLNMTGFTMYGSSKFFLSPIGYKSATFNTSNNSDYGGHPMNEVIVDLKQNQYFEALFYASIVIASKLQVLTSSKLLMERIK